MTWLQPHQAASVMEGDTLSLTVFIHCLWIQMLASKHNTCGALPTQRCPAPSQPPTTPCNMSDQWQQQDPVGNKGYEVWQWCARWSPSSCLFLQVMGSQTEEWKSDQYIDFGGGKFVSPSGILMNQNGHLASCTCTCTKNLLTTGWCGGIHITEKKRKLKVVTLKKHNSVYLHHLCNAD